MEVGDWFGLFPLLPEEWLALLETFAHGPCLLCGWWQLRHWSTTEMSQTEERPVDPSLFHCALGASGLSCLSYSGFALLGL